jgi:hypothetical protein
MSQDPHGFTRLFPQGRSLWFICIITWVLALTASTPNLIPAHGFIAVSLYMERRVSNRPLRVLWVVPRSELYIRSLRNQ